MDAAILADTISDILPWTSSLKPLATRLSAKDISQLETHLKNIREMVKKAKQISHSQGSNANVQPWLRKVKEVVIDLKDLKESTTDTRSLIRSSQNMVHRFTVMHQVKKAAEELKRLSGEAQDLSFSEEGGENERKLEGQESEKTVVTVGRENEKKEIIDQLLNGDVPVPVVAIVGFPGIGKTKLAQLVCEDEHVKAYFGLPTWVPDHKTFDLESIAKRDGKPHLLVLDDLRIEIGLEKLQQKLTEAGGGAILITTRSNFVANNIGGFARYVLQGLNEEESRSLFQQIRERGSSKQDIEWEIFPRDCVGVPLAIIIIARHLKRRGSSDLEAEGVAAAVEKEFLQELKFTYYENLPTYQKLCFAYCSLFPQDYLIDAERLIQLWMAEGFLTWNNVIPAKNTPEEYGRACFDDFVPSVFQQVGEEEKDNKYYGVVRRYRMNSLMHKLARVVARDEEENITVDSEGKRVQDGVVLLRASFDFAWHRIPDSVFEKAKKLRSILFPSDFNMSRLPHEGKMTKSTCDKIFDTFKRLRVLDLHDLGIKMVPSSIGEMKYLRYLDLSYNNMEKLPGSITKLVHLQTLKLSQCHVLKELPKVLGNLSRLRHLDIEGCLDLTQMPRGMNKLTSLQTLSHFVASKNHAMGGLREVTDLNNLRGHLEILHLEQFNFSPSKEEAKDAFLKNKQHLQCLTLRWDHDDDDEVEKKEEEEVNKEGSDGDDKDKKSLECLQPHTQLKVLLVVGYNGHTFSDWLASLENLVKFSLNDCPKCEFLPPLNQLPLLKVLELRRLDSLEFVAKNSEGAGSSGSLSTSTSFFPSLKELTIWDCPKLRSWWAKEIWDNDRPFFPRISKLDVQYCPDLACMPLYPDLDEELVLVDSNVRSIWDTMHAQTSEANLPFSKLKSMLIKHIDEKSPPKRWLKNFVSLEKLHIRDCSQLESLPQGFESLSSLQCLTIERCPKLDLDSSGAGWEGLRNLCSLTVRDIPNLKSLPWAVGNVKSLRDLRIHECSGLTSLPESIGNLTSLCNLVISECESLNSLPKGMQNLKSLDTLIITGCPLLLSRCQPETGDDWPQIAHIKNKQVKEKERYYDYYGQTQMFSSENANACCIS